MSLRREPAPANGHAAVLLFLYSSSHSLSSFNATRRLFFTKEQPAFCLAAQSAIQHHPNSVRANKNQQSDLHPGSFAARTSTFSMDGGSEKRSEAFSIKAAATLPDRC